MISRRRLLLAGLGLVGLSGLGIFAFGRSGIEAAIATILRRRLAYLHLDEEGVRAFASDQAGKLIAKRVSLHRLRYHVAATAGDTFKRFQRSNDPRTRVERIEDPIVISYLMSSDFFLNGADESRSVRYLGFYDALQRPCGNPFARPAWDGDSAANPAHRVRALS
jgi:hypothetical protein